MQRVLYPSLSLLILGIISVTPVITFTNAVLNAQQQHTANPVGELSTYKAINH